MLSGRHDKDIYDFTKCSSSSAMEDGPQQAQQRAQQRAINGPNNGPEEGKTCWMQQSSGALIWSARAGEHQLMGLNHYVDGTTRWSPAPTYDFIYILLFYSRITL